MPLSIKNIDHKNPKSGVNEGELEGGQGRWGLMPSKPIAEMDSVGNRNSSQHRQR